jgi:citrate synthase
LRAESGLPHEATIVGAFAVIAGALVQRAAGFDPVAPDPTSSHAADTLSMLLNRKPDAREVAALDAYLVTACDHGMNASTFATRVVASTQADLFASVTAGYCALTGPLHGGAPEPVLEMLDAIGSRERIKPWVDSALARGERLMGFGHRIYRVRDPRADVLKGAIERLAVNGTDLPFAGEVEAYIREALRREKPDRPLDCGVLHCHPARRAGDSAAGLYADLRGGPRRGMDGARPRTAAGRTADPAKFGLYRPDAGVKSIKNCRHLAERDKLMTSIQVRDSEIA